MVDLANTDNQYDPDIQDTSSETRTLAEVIRIAMDQQLRSMNVWLPCQVVAVRNNSFVDVQPQIMEKFRSQGLVKLPVLQNIPVEHPRGDDYWVKLPVAVGDTGRVVFCDRSLDTWIVNGGIVDPNDTRIHSLSDGVFVPGLTPLSDKITGDPTDLVVMNGKAQIIVKKPGTFQVKNDQQELFDLLDQLLDTLINNTFTNTMIGPQPFIEYTNRLLQDIKTKLETLKG